MGTPAQPYYPQIDKSVDPKVTRHIQNLYTMGNDLNSAIVALKGKLTDVVAGKTVIEQTTTTVQTSGGTTVAGVRSFNTNTGDVTFFPYLGFVNNQTGVTSYTTQTQDDGAFIVLDDSSAIAVTLNYTVTTNWYTWIANYGSGAATLTPGNIPSGATSTITYPGHVAASSMPLNSGYAAFIEFDGKNFWAIPIAINPTTTGVTSLDGITGTITLVAGSNITITNNSPSAGDITIAASGGSSYSLGGTLSSANVTLGAGAGTGATFTITGLDGNHQINVTTGTSPGVSGLIYTLSFTTSRGHVTFPVYQKADAIVYSSPDQEPHVGSSSSTAYSLVSGGTALVASTSYTWNISCP